MSSSRLARRYAKPLLELAEEQGKLDAVKEDMEMFVSLTDDSKDLANMLKSPIIPSSKKLSILEAIFKGKVDELTYSIFEILVKKNRENILIEVGSAFLELYNKLKGIVRATVTTAVSLETATVEEFKKLVREISGQQVTLEQEIDPAVIGGFRLKIADKQIDETVQSKLQDLKLKFTTNA
ncbi:MAG: ATP synthase F1 subunit delta [Cyclobacteriaceae bacterium]